jgi:hypothetical protein
MIDRPSSPNFNLVGTLLELSLPCSIAVCLIRMQTVSVFLKSASAQLRQGKYRELGVELMMIRYWTCAQNRTKTWFDAQFGLWVRYLGT